MAKVKEGQLVKGVRDYVQLHENQGHAYILRNNSIRQQVLRRDGSKGFVVNGKPGSPDLILCVGGRFVGIECKLKLNKQSDLQK